MFKFLFPFFLLGLIVGSGIFLASILLSPPPQDLGPPAGSPRFGEASPKAGEVGLTPKSSVATSSATLTLRYHPFDNHIELLRTEFSTLLPPSPSPEPWNKEGVFLLRVQTTIDGKPYETWAQVEAVEQLWDPETEPEHDVTVILPYQKGMAVRVNEPSSGRSYLQFVL